MKLDTADLGALDAQDISELLKVRGFLLLCECVSGVMSQFDRLEDAFEGYDLGNESGRCEELD